MSTWWMELPPRLAEGLVDRFAAEIAERWAGRECVKTSKLNLLTGEQAVSRIVRKKEKKPE